MGKRLDEIAGRHYPFLDDLYRWNQAVICRWCSDPEHQTPWPCDAAVLLMHIARREQVQEPGTDTEGSGCAQS